MIGYKGFYVDSNNHYYTETDKRYYFEIGETYSIPDEQPVKLCRSGYHYCDTILDVLSYRDNLNNLRIGEIEVLGEISNDSYIFTSGGKKFSTRAFKLVRILTEGEIEEILKKETGNDSIIWSSYCLENSSKVFNSSCIKHSRDIQNSDAVMNGHFVKDSRGISYADKILNCYGLNRTCKAKYSNAIDCSENVINSDAISESEYVIGSRCVWDSKNIINSNNVKNSYGISHSDNVYRSCGVSTSENITRGFYIDSCKNLSNSLFCYELENCKNMVFNKQVSEERFEYIIRYFGNSFIVDYPHFINEVRLLTEIVGNDSKTSYQRIKSSVWQSIFNLDEFDEEIFYRITGLSIEEIKEDNKVNL